MPRISVVIPCYNSHRYLAETIESVRVQSFRDFEIIVVDDGSNAPETVAFLNAMPGDVRLVRQDNRGLSAARNAGFAAARGEFVLPLDADDRIEPRMLELCLAELEQSTAGYAYTQISVFGDEHGRVFKTWNFFEQLATNQLPYCMLMRRSVWTLAGGYDEAMRDGYEDWEFNLRISKAGVQGVLVPLPLFRYRRLATGMLQSVSQLRHARIWRSIRHKHPDLYALPSLWRLWRIWRRQPSTHALAGVWILLVAQAVMPDRLFNRFFLLLHRLKASPRHPADR